MLAVSIACCTTDGVRECVYSLCLGHNVSAQNRQCYLDCHVDSEQTLN
jgi:hypothetical protein